MTLDWDNPAFSGPLCRYCARPRATTEARNFWKEQGCAAEGHGSEILCWNESETACGAWLKPHEAYELAVKDVVAWLRENNDLKRCWTLADAIEAGAHFGKGRTKMSTDEILCVKCRAPACDHVLTELGRLRVALEATKVVLEAAREATCDTHTIPACVRLGKALREYDERRGAICAQCDGAGTIDGADDEPGEGPPCDRCSGRGRFEQAAAS